MHRLFRISLIAVALLWLAACTISSEKSLVTDTESVTPLPAHFALVPYEADASGTYARASDPPADFVLEGTHYVSMDMADTKGSVVARFVALGPATYLLAASDVDDSGTIYAVATYHDGVLSMALTPSDDTAKSLTAERARATPDAQKLIDQLAVAPDTGAITIKDRAALDELVKLYVAGRLPMAKSTIAFIAAPGVTPPAKLVPNEVGWTLTP